MEWIPEQVLATHHWSFASPVGHLLRTASFLLGTNHLETERFVRRRGRPCKEWLPHLLQVAVKVFGSMHAVEDCAQDKLS